VLHHLAVLNAGYLEEIIRGLKVIECRLGTTDRPAHGHTRAGDLIWLKEVAGPIRAVASASSVRVFEDLTPAGVDEIRRTFDAGIRAIPDFWLKKRDATAATLIWLASVCPLRPFRVHKRDRRGWVVLADPPIPGRRLRAADPATVVSRRDRAYL